MTVRAAGAALATLVAVLALAGVAQAGPGWVPVPDMNDERSSFELTPLADGRVLATGGWSVLGSTGFIRSTEVYDPAARTWTTAPSMLDQRGHHAAATLPDGRILVSGGLGRMGSLTATAELYDPATGTWSRAGSMATGRLWHTATTLPDGRVLVTGGSDEGPSAELYDPETNTFSAAEPMAVQRTAHTATVLPNGQILVAGGSSSDATAELYDPDTGEWSPAASMSMPRVFPTATLLESGKVLVTGGDSGGAPQPTAELYDPEAGAWTPAAPMQVARTWHTATTLSDGRVLVAGGGRTVEEAEVYDPATGTWSAAPSMSRGRMLAGATLVAGGDVLVAGGTDADGELASAELYTAEMPPPEPSPTPTPTATPEPSPEPVASFLRIEPGADRTGPTIAPASAGRSLRATRAGVVRLRLGSASEDASGRIVLKAGRRGIGTASFQARTSRPVVVEVKLRSAGRRLLRRSGRLTARFRITLRDAAGNETARAYRFTIRAARR